MVQSVEPGLAAQLSGAVPPVPPSTIPGNPCGISASAPRALSWVWEPLGFSFCASFSKLCPESQKA